MIGQIFQFRAMLLAAEMMGSEARISTPTERSCPYPQTTIHEYICSLYSFNFCLGYVDVQQFNATSKCIGNEIATLTTGFRPTNDELGEIVNMILDNIPLCA